MKLSVAAILMITWEAFEVLSLFTEARWQRSASPVFRTVEAIKKRRLLRTGSGFVWGIDTYGNLVHLLLILILAAFVSLTTTDGWIITLQMAFVAFSLVVVLADILHWIPASSELFFKSLRVSAEHTRLSRDIFGNQGNWQVRAAQLRARVESLHLSTVIPHFVRRFVLVLVLVVVSFAYEYAMLNRLDSSSFRSSSGDGVTLPREKNPAEEFCGAIPQPFATACNTVTSETADFMVFLYQSAMVTATFGPPFEPFGWAKLVVAAHALITVYLFIIVVGFFTSLSENRLLAEKESFVREYNDLLQLDDGRVGLAIAGTR